MNDRCPTCLSDDVLVGVFVLECYHCGYHYLNTHPCRTCGKPSRRSMGCSGPGYNLQLYGCADHPFTEQEIENSRRLGQ